MKIYSHSKLSTFEQCNLKYKLKYLDKIKPEIEKSIEAHLGTAVHNTLEWLYTGIKNKKMPSLDEVITFYAETWQEEFSEDILIVKQTLTAKDYFEKGIQFLINYYTKHQPFDDNTLELEKRVTIQLTKEHQIIGFIDRLAYNLKTKQYEVHDYKTANNLPNQEKFDSDRQLALYSIAIKELFGHDKEVILIWHYLAHDKKITSKRTNEQLNKLKKETIELIKKIESTTKFPYEKSILCDWCEYKTMCPAYGNTLPKTANEKQSNLKEHPFLKRN